MDEVAVRVRASFARQQVMNLIGAQIVHVAAGKVTISLPVRAELSQQHGFVHAGIVTTIVDSACGYAAMSLADPATAVLTVEYKVNFVAPAAGELLIAHGEVRKAGRTLSICNGEVYARSGDAEKLVAIMQATIMLIAERPDLPHP